MDDAIRKLFNLPAWIEVQDSDLQFTLSYPNQKHENTNLFDLNFDNIYLIGNIHQQVNVEPPNITIQLSGEDTEFRSLIQNPPYSARCYVKKYNYLGEVKTIFTGSIWQINISENITMTLVY